MIFTAVFKEDFYLYDKNSASELFHLHSFGKLYPDKSYIISRQENTDTIIECVTDGTGYIEYNGIVTTVTKGDCYIIKPGGAHRYYSDEKMPYTKLWICVSGDIIEKWLKIYNIDSPVFVRSLDITPYYNRIKQAALNGTSFDTEKNIMLLIHDILFEMGMVAPKKSKSQKSDRPYIKTDGNIVIDVKKYIEKHCNDRLTEKELTVKFGISASKLNKMFTEKYEITPIKYHMQCKLKSAVYFLESTDLGIDTICETTCFYDRSHFTKTFYDAYGVTPARYRKQYLLQIKKS